MKNNEEITMKDLFDLEYPFTDISLAAALRSLHIQVKVEMISPITALFSTPFSPKVLQISISFYRKNLMLNPHAYNAEKIKLIQIVNKFKEVGK